MFKEIFQKLFAWSICQFYMHYNRTDKLPEDKEEFRSFMKEHEGDWYKSDEFAMIFTRCPAVALNAVAKAYYGDGHRTEAGVDLSARVVECLKRAYGQFKQEQHTFANALVAGAVLKSLGVDIENENQQEAASC